MGRNEQLDGLRGYAAVAVIFFHAIHQSDTSGGSKLLISPITQVSDPYLLCKKLALSVFNGNAAVMVFFVMSGAVLIDALRREQGPMLAVARRFAIRRVFRIYPVLLLAIFVAAIIHSAVVAPVTQSDMIGSVLLYDFKLVGGSWTLQVEMLAMLLLLPAIAAYRRFGEVGLIVAVMVCGTMLYLPQFKEYAYYPKIGFLAFALGIMIPTRAGAWITGRLHHALWPVALIVMLFATNVVEGHFRTTSITQSIAAAVVVGMLYYGRAGAFGRFLARPVSVFLGSISYSLYLLNEPLLAVFERMGPFPHSLEAGLIGGAVITLISIPVSYLALNWIEKPGIALGRIFAKQITSAPSAGALQVTPQPQMRSDVPGIANAA